MDSELKQNSIPKSDLSVAQGITVVYFEDDAMSRKAMELILTRVMRLSNVFIFEDSTDCMGRLKGLPQVPDLLLLDIHMKPFTGIEVLKLVRAEPAFDSVRVIALTASVMNDEVETLRNHGFDAVISKPINVASFPSVIGRVLNGEGIWGVVE